MKKFLLLTAFIALLFNVHSADSSPSVRALKRGCFLSYLPSYEKLSIRVDLSRRVVLLPSAARNARNFTDLTFSLRRNNGEKVVEKNFKLEQGILPEQTFDLPLDGEYLAVFHFEGNGKSAEVTHPLSREKFVWEKSPLPDTSARVYPPFTPVRAEGNSAEVVLRKYCLNGFGLPDSILAGSPDSEPAGARPETLKREELLAGPAVVAGSISGREIVWRKKSVRKISSDARQAEWECSAMSDLLKIDSRVLLEYDGVLKIRMSLIPAGEIALDRLFIDIPLKAEEVPYFHAVTDGIRINDAGVLPDGKGAVWKSPQARRGSEWQNSFVPYIYLGGAARGLAFFAENDRNWLTVKGDLKTPVQEILRDGKSVVLRIYLCNAPAVLKKPCTILFGLQASPVKPLGNDWRLRLRTDPAYSGPVTPWGGLHCASMGPYRERWDIVDDIIAAQEGKPFDKTALVRKIEILNPPNVLGNNKYLDRQLYFASRSERPILVYHEENQASQIRPEWITFQDEWGINNYTTREWPDEEVLRRGFSVNPSSRINFCGSYLKYGLYYANQWLKRGIGLYWDNDYPTPSFNLRIPDGAYLAENGGVQPSVNFWNRREYHKRIFELQQYWSEKLGKRIVWSNHMTNTMILPFNGFATVMLDYELHSEKPFESGYILVTSAGGKCGAIGNALYNLLGSNNPDFLEFKKKNPFRAILAQWGVSAAYELSVHGKYGFGDTLTLFDKRFPSEKNPIHILYGFGYGTPTVEVCPMWEKPVVFATGTDQVIYLLLRNRKSGRCMILLQNVSGKEIVVKPEFSGDLAGKAHKRFRDVLGGGTPFVMGPWQTQILEEEK